MIEPGNFASIKRRARIVDVDAVQCGGERVGVTFPPNLAVGNVVEPRILLRPDREQRRVILRLRQELRRHPPQLGSPDPRREPPGQPLPVDQPVRLGITANERGRKEHKGLQKHGQLSRPSMPSLAGSSRAAGD